VCAFTVFTLALSHWYRLPRAIAGKNKKGDRRESSGNNGTPVLTLSDDENPKIKYPRNIASITYACVMIIALGWVTLPTGGSFYSPYAPLLIGCSLTANYVAKERYRGAIVSVLGFVAYLVFGAIPLISSGEIPNGHPPYLVIGWTTAVTTTISLCAAQWESIAKFFRWLCDKLGI
jgi:hypothetical protein